MTGWVHIGSAQLRIGKLMKLLQSLRDTVTQPREEKASRDAIPAETAYDILHSERRRLIIEFIGTHDIDTTTTIDEIHDYLVQHGDEPNPSRVSLYQTHLPRLDSAGLIEYERDSGEVLPLPPVYRVYEAHEVFQTALG